MYKLHSIPPISIKLIDWIIINQDQLALTHLTAIRLFPYSLPIGSMAN